MLDYCGEIDLYPMDGEWDNYYEYTPIEELGLDEHLRAELRGTHANNPVFVKDSNWYDIWASFDRNIERDTCYSILRNNTWVNIPKKIVREIKDNEMFVYGPIFNKICEKNVFPVFNLKVKEETKMSHSSIAGGSTAKRVIACPASVKLVQQMPPKPSSSFADEGTLCHLAMEKLLTEDSFNIYSLSYAGIDMTTELAKEKIEPALAALDEIDPTKSMEFTVEANVSYGDFLPEVFGSVDLIGRLGDRAVILDWKFGSGVSVEVEENEQLMFYAAAAMRTKGLEWVFDGAASIELVIVQPPSVKRWKTTFKRIREFENTLKKAIDLSDAPDAPLASGKHCKWCAAKPTCPLMTGEVDRALQASLDNIDAESIANYLQQAEILEQWITDLRALAFQMLEAGKPVPNYKLVAKRGTRKWTNESEAVESLLALGLTNDDIYDSKLVSPAQAEKKLKALKLPMPTDVIAVVSSGSTMAHESDPRPTVLLIGQQLTNALNKL